MDRDGFNKVIKKRLDIIARAPPHMEKNNDNVLLRQLGIIGPNKPIKGKSYKILNKEPGHEGGIIQFGTTNAYKFKKKSKRKGTKHNHRLEYVERERDHDF